MKQVRDENVQIRPLSKQDFLKGQYEIRVLPDEDAESPGYIAMCPQLSGLMGYGATEAKALKDFQRSKSDWYDMAVEARVPVPPPAVETEQQFSGKFMLRTAPELHKVLTDRAASEGVSLNSFCQRLLREGLFPREAGSSMGAADSMREMVRQLLPVLLDELKDSGWHLVPAKSDWALQGFPGSNDSSLPHAEWGNEESFETKQTRNTIPKGWN